MSRIRRSIVATGPSAAVDLSPEPAPRAERRTMTDRALEALREQILSGAFPEGAPLRQDALAAELGISRIPVREALRQLEAEGLVTFSPHCGAVVSTLSIEEMEELFEMRGLLESELLRLAVPHLTPADHDRADAILDAYEAAFEQGDVAEWGALNWRFHSTLLAAAGRPLTLGVLANLHDQSERYTRMQLALTHGEGRATDEHRSIAAAARAGRPDEAAALLRGHVLDAGRSLIDFLRVHRSQESGSRRKGSR
jgi:DNA-binding GntR family transcriptional regulator